MGAQPFELSTRECLEHVRSRAIGRMCIVDHGCPLAVPINYRLTFDAEPMAIVRTAPDTMLGRYEGPASLEVDDIDLARGTAWSVFMRGQIRRPLDASGLPDPNPLISEGRVRWLSLEVSAVSGRRFVIAPSADGMSVEWQLG